VVTQGDRSWYKFAYLYTTETCRCTSWSCGKKFHNWRAL